MTHTDYLWIFIAITSSKFSLSAIRVSENLAFSWDSRTINFKKTSCLQSELISKSEQSTLMTKFANCRSGILLVKNVSRQLLQATIRELMVLLWPTISPTETRSTPYIPGWLKLKSIHRTTSLEFWLETKPILSQNEQSHLKKDKRWLITTVSDSLRHLLRNARMLIKLSSLWLVRSRQMLPVLHSVVARLMTLKEELLNWQDQKHSPLRRRAAAEKSVYASQFSKPSLLLPFVILSM